MPKSGKHDKFDLMMAPEEKLRSPNSEWVDSPHTTNLYLNPSNCFLDIFWVSGRSVRCWAQHKHTHIWAVPKFLSSHSWRGLFGACEQKWFGSQMENFFHSCSFWTKITRCCVNIHRHIKLQVDVWATFLCSSMMSKTETGAFIGKWHTLMWGWWQPFPYIWKHSCKV